PRCILILLPSLFHLCLFLCFRSIISCFSFFFFFNDTATTEIYTLSLHDALPISGVVFHRSPFVRSTACRDAIPPRRQGAKGKTRPAAARTRTGPARAASCPRPRSACRPSGGRQRAGCSRGASALRRRRTPRPPVR